MASVVLVDTGPLYALSDPPDQYHRRAQQEAIRLEAEGILVAIAYTTVAEAYTLVLRRLGSGYARGGLQDVSSGAILLSPDADDYQRASLCIQKYADQPITLFDAVTAVLSAKLNQPVWTYDHHFELMRAARWT